jgi:N6-adenosine-specific RNA methylase IME4
MNFPTDKYNLIVVDPAWQLKVIKRRVRPGQVEMPYRTMGLDEIKALPITTIAEDNSWCFLWTIQKYLFEAKSILEAWGFRHFITMAWQKTGMYHGASLFGFNWNAEFILVGTRGKKEMYPRQKNVKCAFQAKNIRHSQKPDEFYDMIKHLGDKRIDMFARHRREGWDAWGDELLSNP